MDKITKSILGSITYVFAYISNSMTDLFVVLAIFMIFDYITGIIVAVKEKKFNYNLGLWGAVKKLFYVMILATSFLADFSINYMMQKTGIGFKTYGSLGFVLTFYLIGNEGISLYKNWLKLGLPVPKVIYSVFTNFQLLARKENKKNRKDE